MQVPDKHMRFMTKAEGQRAIDRHQVAEIESEIAMNPNATGQPMQLIVMPLSKTPADIVLPELLNSEADLNYELAVSGGQHGLAALRSAMQKNSSLRGLDNFKRHNAQVCPLRPFNVMMLL